MARYNPAPGWPVPATGWVPADDWQPDPRWPTPPPGWCVWVPDTSAFSSASTFFSLDGGPDTELVNTGQAGPDKDVGSLPIAAPARPPAAIGGPNFTPRSTFLRVGLGVTAAAALTVGALAMLTSAPSMRPAGALGRAEAPTRLGAGELVSKDLGAPDGGPAAELRRSSRDALLKTVQQYRMSLQTGTDVLSKETPSENSTAFRFALLDKRSAPAQFLALQLAQHPETDVSYLQTGAQERAKYAPAEPPAALTQWEKGLHTLNGDFLAWQQTAELWEVSEKSQAELDDATQAVADDLTVADEQARLLR